MPKPFHSMAAHREKGAKEALMLLRSASRVSSVCNDVVGDICGIVSGSTAAVIVTRLPDGAGYAFRAGVRGHHSADLRAYHRRKGIGQDLCHPEQHPGGLLGRGAFCICSTAERSLHV